MTIATTSRETISLKSILVFILGWTSGVFLIILLCCVILLSGCESLRITTRNNGDGQESCVVIKVPSALRVCYPSSPQPEDSE